MTRSGAARRLHGFQAVTLGCKLNQFDGAGIQGELRRRGYVPVDDARDASIVVINTCTVTHRADAEARRLIRAARRRNADCLVVVTGCYAEREGELLRAMPEVDRVFGNREKAEWPRILDELGLEPRALATRRGEVLLADRGCDAALRLPEALHFGDRSRAFLKIQEGCRLACSYCIIPTVRGASRSVPVERVCAAAETLFASGYREVVLTGVNTGDYGRDLAPTTDLARLLRRLLAVCGPNRIRLNSLEPLTVTDEIVELLATEPRLASHLQVPLQSGSDAVLRGMRRNYGREEYLRRLERLRAAVPDIGLGADVMVGFPGESEACFDQTHAFIADSPLSYLHVFSWSPRPGTHAARLGDRVPPRTIRSRATRLRELGVAKASRFRRRFVGRTLDAVVLGPRSGDGRVRALTGNFIEVSLDPGSAARGDLVGVRILDLPDGEPRAKVEAAPGWAHAGPLPRSRPGRPETASVGS